MQKWSNVVSCGLKLCQMPAYAVIKSWFTAQCASDHRTLKKEQSTS